MLKGIAKLGLAEAKKQSKKEVEKKRYPNFMVSDDDVNALMKTLKIEDVKEPHFFVLDAEGKVVYHTQGEYSEQKMNEITERLL
jgi:predicted transcriptional regulator